MGESIQTARVLALFSSRVLAGYCVAAGFSPLFIFLICVVQICSRLLPSADLASDGSPSGTATIYALPAGLALSLPDAAFAGIGPRNGLG